MPNIFIKTLTGKTIPIDIENCHTFLDIKKMIAHKESIPYNYQRLVFAGIEVSDEMPISNFEFQKTNCLHLVIRRTPEFDFNTHNFYITMQNYYEDTPHHSRLLSAFSCVEPISLFEPLESLKIKFEKIYALREARIDKNKQHTSQNPSHLIYPMLTNDPTPIFGLVAVESSSSYLTSYNDGTKSVFSQSQSQFLNYQLLNYMLEDGTVVTYVPQDEQVRKRISYIQEQFALFCKYKASELYRKNLNQANLPKSSQPIKPETQPPPGKKLEPYLITFKQGFRNLGLKSIGWNLKQKSHFRFSSSREAIAKVFELDENLEKKLDLFFRNPNASTAAELRRQSSILFRDAYGIINSHRGWYNLDHKLRKFIGILCLCTVVIAVIIAVVLAGDMGENYYSTFFSTLPPKETASARKLKEAEMVFNQNLDNLQDKIAKGETPTPSYSG